MISYRVCHLTSPRLHRTAASNLSGTSHQPLQLNHLPCAGCISYCPQHRASWTSSGLVTCKAHYPSSYKILAYSHNHWPLATPWRLGHTDACYATPRRPQQIDASYPLAMPMYGREVSYKLHHVVQYRAITSLSKLLAILMHPDVSVVNGKSGNPTNHSPPYSRTTFVAMPRPNDKAPKLGK